MLNPKRHFQIIFFTVFLNVAGFTITYPLYPALLNYYLNTEIQQSGFFFGLINIAEAISTSIGHQHPLFLTSVVFGCLIGALYSALQFIFAAFWGRLSDRFGRRTILLYTLLGGVFANLLWFIAARFEVFIIAIIIVGIMSGNIAVASAAAADITSRKERTKAMAIVGTAFGLGYLMGPAIGGLASKVNLVHLAPTVIPVLGLHPLSFPALIAFVLAAFNWLWALTHFKETLTIQNNNNNTSTHTSFIKNLTTQTPAIRNVNVIFFFFMLVFSGLEFTLSFLVTERFHYTSLQVGYLFFFTGSILVITQSLLIKKLASLIGEKLTALCGVCGMMLAFNTIAFSHGHALFLLGAAIMACSLGLSSTSLTGLISLYTPEALQGQSMGLFRSAAALARVFGPLCVAALYFYSDSTKTYFFTSLLLIWPIINIFILPPPNAALA